MKKKIYNILSVCLFVLLVSACYDDKGNYDYHEISTINTEGLEKSYTKTSFQDVLHLEPTVTATGGESDFEYLWTLNLTKGSGTTSNKIEIVLDTIGTNQVLDFPVNIKQGFYDLTFRVTNKSNKLEMYQVMSLSVVTKFSEGFYLLKDMGNSTDVDLHASDNSLVDNIFLKMDGEHMPDAPVSLGLDPGYCFVDETTAEYVITKALTVCTEKDVRISNIEDMSTIYTHSTMFLGGEAPEEKPYYVWRNAYGVGYTSDKGVYFSTQASLWDLLGTGKFGFPAMVNDDEETKPNRNGVFASSCFYYLDELKGRFLFLDYNGSLHTYNDLDENNEEKPNKPNGITHHLKFFGKNYMDKKSTGYALFEDGNIAGKHYIYQLVLGIDPSNPIEKVTEVATSSKLNGANLFAVNELTAKVMYFVNDNQLYMYDLIQNTEELLRPTDMTTGEEITYISNRYWSGSDNADKNFDYLVFATHKDGKYKVYLYEILGGKPYGKPVRVLEGEGKVVKMHYVDPSMSMVSYDYFPNSF